MLGRWLRAIAAIIVLTALLVGIPWVLIRLAGWPLPTTVPDWELASRMARQGDIPAATVMKAIAVVVWFAWVQLAWAVLWELIVNVPRTINGDPSREAPAVAEPVAGGVGRLFAAIMAVGVLTAAPVAATRGALPAMAAPPAAATAETSEPVVSAVTRSPSPHMAGLPSWKVSADDSLWSIAETALGDGTRVEEILELNPRLSPRQLQAGQLVLLPAGARVPAERIPPVATADTSSGYPDEDADGSTAVMEVPPVPAMTVVVDGDTLWDLAESRLAAAELPADPDSTAEQVERITAANPDNIDDPDLIFPGQQLAMPDPVNAAPPSTDAAGATTAVNGHAVDLGVVPVSTAAASYVVADGDSYWRIAEATLRIELGREPAGAEVLALTHHLIAGNAARLGTVDEPHLLHPGDVVHLTDATTSPPLTEQPSPAPVVPAPLPAPVAPQSPVATVPAPPPDAAVAAPLLTSPTLAATPPADTPVPASAPAVPAAASSTSGDVAGVSAPVGVLAGMSAVAFAGFAATWWRRRRRANQRARPHQRPAPIAARHRDVVAEVVQRDVSAVARIAAELRWLAHQLPSAPDGSLTVQLVQCDDRGGLEVAFAEIPAVAAPPGWCAAAERVWRLSEPHDDDVLATLAEAPPVLPALVTLGAASGGGQLLVNLEAAPGVNLSGDEPLVTAWLTSVVWEIAGAALGEGPSVVLVDVDIDGADELPGVIRLSGPEAVAGVAADHDHDRGDVGMLRRRVGEWEAWPSTVVVIDGAAVDAAWADLAARPAVAVIAVDGHLPGGLDVVVADGELAIPAWRLRVPATGLDPATAAAAIDVLGEADTDPVDDELDIASPTGDTPLEAAVVDGGWVPPTWPVMVHLLGEPFAARDGRRLALSPQMLSALAYLAVQRNVSVDDFKEAMWGGEAVPEHRVRDLLANTRKAAGGRPVVAYVEDCRVRAGPDLGVDLAVFEALNTRAQQAPVELTTRMHQIMDQVRGRPFAYSSTVAHLWLWVDHPEHLQALWGLRVSTVAWELAGLYLDRDNPEVAREVAERGLIADPLNAALTERLMESYAALNAVEAAQRVYESHDRALTSRGFEGASVETRRVLERLRAAHFATLEAAVGS